MSHEISVFRRSEHLQGALEPDVPGPAEGRRGMGDSPATASNKETMNNLS